MSERTPEPQRPADETPGTATALPVAPQPTGLEALLAEHFITDPTADPFTTMQTAEQLFAAKRYTDAARLVDALAGTPEGASRHARELLARSYYHSAQLAKAADAARELLDVDPTNVDAAVLLTRALERAGKKDEAAPVRRLATSLGADI